MLHVEACILTGVARSVSLCSVGDPWRVLDSAAIKPYQQARNGWGFAVLLFPGRGLRCLAGSNVSKYGFGSPCQVGLR
jgi:hypothetical protein